MKPLNLKSFRTVGFVSKGFTLIELGMVIAIVAILAAFGMVTLGNTEEQRDASAVQAAQASLQTVVSQGATRMDVSPKELRDSYSQQILYAIQATVGQSGSSGDVRFSGSAGRFVMDIESSGREATFEIQDNGDVNLVTVKKFTMYEARNGIIKKI